MNANAAAALDAKQVTLVVVHKYSVVDIFMNGLPFRQVKADALASDTVGSVGMIALDGENTVRVVAHPIGDPAKSETTFTIMINTGAMADFDKPPVFEKKIAGAGEVEYKMTISGALRSAFMEGAPYTGDTQGLLDSAKAMYQAFASHNTNEILAMVRPSYDESKKALGDELPSWEESKQDYVDLKDWKLDPLPAKLKVTAAYGNRLFTVTSEDNAPPIRLIQKAPPGYGRDLMWDLGQFWIHSGGKWIPIQR
jgi:hypothetical protein